MSKRADPIRSGNRSPIRVLCVSAGPGAREVAATLDTTSRDRFRITSVADASEGDIRIDDIDCIVADYDLPGESGITLLESVRQRDPDIPFFVFFSEHNRDGIAEAIRNGATDYIQADEQRALLTNRIENAVTSYWARQAERCRKQRRKRQRELLVKLATDDAVTAGKLEAAARRLTEAATAVLDVRRANVWLLDDSDSDNDGGDGDGDGDNDDGNSVLSCIDHYDRSTDEHDSGMELPTAEYPEYIDALASHRTIDADDALTDPRTSCLADYLTANNIPSLLDGTLRSEGEVIGVVCIEPVGEKREWQEDEIQFVGELADLVHRTLRNKRERELRERELGQYTELVQTVGDPMYGMDPDGCFERVNDAFLEYTGYDREQIIGAHGTVAIAEDSFQRRIEVLDELSDDREKQWATYELTVVTADGEEILTEDKVTPVTDENGTVAGSVGVLRDIRERKQRELELKRQNERLDRFASMVSHDLRNPLGVAKMQAGSLADDNEHASAILDALDWMETMIDELLSLARAGQDIETTEQYQLADLVEDAWANVQTAESELDCRLDDVTVDADATRLSQAFENLFRNAIDHNNRPLVVRVGPCETGDGFYVEDNGTGIPENERTDIFDPGHTTSDAGNGLGLAIVSDIVRAHGWSITATESDGGGARFEIRTDR